MTTNGRAEERLSAADEGLSVADEQVIHGLLRHATAEVARLLEVDGAMAYLVQEEGRVLRFAADAGIRHPEVQSLIRGLELPVGVGLFGTAVETMEVIATTDYRKDKRFRHSDVADRIVRLANMRSMVVAPLVADGEALGGLGAYSARIDAFSETQVALLRALADHAAAAVANQRLIGRLARSQAELARRVEAQETLGGITARIAVIRESGEVLQRVVDAAKRLIGSDGAHLTLLDARAAVLRPAVVAGGMDDATRAWMATQEFPINGGINGLAAGRAEPTWTADYRLDQRIPHEPEDEATMDRLGLRGVAAAPMRAPAGGIIGTLAVSFTQPHEFTADEIALLSGLADQGAIAITNARLTDELRQRSEAQRALAEMAPQLSAIREPSAVLRQTLEAAVRLLGGDGGQIGMVSTAPGDELRWGDGHSLAHGELLGFTKEDRTPVGEGVSGRAIREGQASWTDDYVADASFAHDAISDAYAQRLGIRSVVAAPLFGDSGPMGAIAVHSERSAAFDADDADLLGLLADQAAKVLVNARLYEELEHRVEAQRTLGEIAVGITAIRDPGDVLQRTLDEAVRLLDADGGRIELTDDAGGLNWAFGHSAIDLPVEFGDEPSAAQPAGVSALAVSGRRVVVTGDYLADSSFEHGPGPDRYIRQHGIRSVMSAPMIADEGAIGSLSVHAQARDAFGPADVELIEVLAAQAAIAVTNARLYEQLTGRVEAQGALADITTELVALRDPATVLQQTADAARRLLDADAALINPLDSEESLGWAVAYAPAGETVDDIGVTVGEGISGLAIARGEVIRTGDYLTDDAFTHTPGLDDYIRRRGMRSVMTAPLTGARGGIGALTVQSSRRDAFGPDDAELLKLLANQAAIAITNARLYAQLTDSELRYRFLVDNSPDIVWSVDAEGRLTFLSESLEARTGWRPADLLGKHYSVLTDGDEDSASTLSAMWERLQASPTNEQRLRIELPRADGTRAPTEVTVVGTVVDGRYAGAHGSIRDVSERERMEQDLRTQAAELAANQERAHLARELHDSVTQALFSMGLTLRSLEIQLATDPEAAGARLSELRELQKDALAEMRTLIFELRPASLETDGLAQALRNHAAAVAGRTGLGVSVDADLPDRLPLPTEEALYRIGQEALHNVVKHANADRAAIRLSREGDLVRLMVTDDGSGFVPEEVPRGHLGLIGMRQRADLVGADLKVHSERGRGTRVEVEVPVPVTEAEPVSASAE